MVLGVHDGHNASAALLRDGRIELALQEERLTRVKNQGDAPAGAVRAALAAANGGLSPAASARGGAERPLHELSPVGARDDPARLRALLEPGLTPEATFEELVGRPRLPAAAGGGAGRAPGAIGLRGGELAPVEHHQAHAAAAYYTAPWGKTGEKVLVLTCDGSGDRFSATVSIGEKAGSRASPK